MTWHALAAALALCTLLTVVALLGRRVAGAFLDVSDGSLTALASPLLGAGLLGVAYLLAAALGLAQDWVLFGGVVVSGWIGWAARGSLMVNCEELRNEVLSYPGLSTIGTVAMVLVIPFALGPVVDWDSLSFHLRLPLEILKTDSLRVAADSMHGAQFGITHFFTLPLLALGLEPAPALFSIFTLWISVLATGIVAGRLAGPAAARLAVFALIASPMVLLTAMTPRVDVPLLAMISVITLAMISDRDEQVHSRLGWLLVGCGLAAATKFHGLAFGGLVVIGILLSRADRQRLKVVWPAVALAICIAAPWYLKNMIQYGGPIYPFGAKPLLEPWLAELVGSATLPDSFDRGFEATLSNAREPFSIWSWFVSPGELTAEVEGQWYRPSLLLLATPLVFLTPSRRAAVTAVIAAALYAILVLAVSSSTNLRYLLPIFVPFSVAASVVSSKLIATSTGVRSRIREGLVMVVGILSLLPFLWSWYPQGIRSVIAGIGDARLSWSQSPDETVRLLGPVRDLVHSHVGDGDRMLMLFDARGGAFRADVITDSRIANWPILAQTAAPSSCLSGTGITHVLVNGGAIGYYVRRGADPLALHLPALDRFVGDCTMPVGSVNGFSLLRLVSSSSTRDMP